MVQNVKNQSKSIDLLWFYPVKQHFSDFQSPGKPLFRSPYQSWNANSTSEASLLIPTRLISPWFQSSSR